MQDQLFDINTYVVITKDPIKKITNDLKELLKRWKSKGFIDMDNRINFLDVTIMIKNNRIIFDNYNKPTFSGRVLNFYLYHPPCHKNGVIISLVDRILLLSHPQFHQINFKKAIELLLNNSYHQALIFSTMNKRLKYHSHNLRQEKTLPLTVDKFFTIPYIKPVSESFIFVASYVHKKVAYTIPNTLNKFIGRGKDKLSKLSQQGVVYKISCHDCGARTT
ncbi:hypothetical protein ALC57_09019 [Trachymyrmex cornetzi]|uniref:Helix-turn-helix domain-containing protein n=1 Tax=Trachymyrmex cornetzi TaxID=471704 RepID=A0A151J664_9HYME|nr:hypothetical protein ALC57_09019 [Trachymyrmex cornetzi]